jgi:hypothetical protein
MAEKLMTKKQLRERGWTHRQVKELTPDGTVKTGLKGRPAFGYSTITVKSAEASRS